MIHLCMYVYDDFRVTVAELSSYNRDPHVLHHLKFLLSGFFQNSVQIARFCNSLPRRQKQIHLERDGNLGYLKKSLTYKLKRTGTTQILLL